MKNWVKLASLLTIVLVLLTAYNLSGLSLPSNESRFRKSQAYIAESEQRFSLPSFSYNGAGFSATTSDNSVLVLDDTVSSFEKMIDEIDAANSSVNIETFVLRDDQTGQKLKETLIKKADQGVTVRLLYDALGSFFTSSKFFSDLENGGVKVEAFNPLATSIIQGRLDNRMHGKIVVIDGIQAIIGGDNFGNEYLGLDPKLGYWKGLNVLVKGSAVNSIQQIFFKDWYIACGEKVMDKNDYPLPSGTSNQTVSMAWGEPDSRLNNMSTQFCSLAHSADSKIYIETPYFLPDQDLLNALLEASNRGVDIHILIPARSDHRIDQLARKFYLEKILQKGIKVSMYNQGYLHTKLMLVDSSIAVVGSANFDKRSGAKNYEIDAVIYDSEVAGQLEEAFYNDLKYSSSLTSDTRKYGFVQRTLSKAAAMLLSIV